MGVARDAARGAGELIHGHLAQRHDLGRALIPHIQHWHQEALERGEARREQLRAARTANIERGMMAVTTIVYNGSMSGGAVSI